ncbi:MAG TPA: ABC transporter permease [Cyclobacteriaceae bacterium]|jgi:ABC-2 type transport system permease protein|nr:ABC transporter permease [Cyclobacteriaceae bacterium]
MNQNTRSLLALTKASLKMYYRNKGAIVFSLLIPIALLSIFGFLSRGRGTSIQIGLTNHSTGEVSKQFVEKLKGVKAFNIKDITEEEAASELGKGNLDLQVIVPENFGAMESDKLVASTIQTRFNKAKPQSGQIANLAIVEIVSNLDRQLTHSPSTLDVKSEGVTTNNLGYFDFILPGILSMTIMQLGIFGVAFGFVAMKSSGALRRLQATPVHPIYFVFAQAFVRMLITLANALILVTLGTYFFGFHMVGSYFSFAFVCIVAILIFLGFGFAIAGWAKDETQVAPVANLIQLPMLLLSGIFFPRDGFPTWLKTITDYFPLTYVSHSLRKIANEGMSLVQLPVDLIGMSVWLVIVYVVAVRVFKWE